MALLIDSIILYEHIILYFIALLFPFILAALLSRKEGRSALGRGLIYGGLIGMISNIIDIFVKISQILYHCTDTCGIENFVLLPVNILYVIVGIFITIREERSELPEEGKSSLRQRILAVLFTLAGTGLAIYGIFWILDKMIYTSVKIYGVGMIVLGFLSLLFAYNLRKGRV